MLKSLFAVHNIASYAVKFKKDSIECLLHDYVQEHDNNK